MNETEKRTYFAQYRSLYAKLSNKFRPTVEKALRSMIREFTTEYVNSPYITPQVISPKPLYKALKSLHIVSGVTNAKRVYKSIKRQTKAYPTDAADVWTWVINEYLRTNGLDNLTLEITNTLRKKILSVIQEGVSQGWGPDKIAAELNTSSFPRWMALRIVRTELNKAMNTGAMVAATDIGVQVNKQWLSVLDKRTRIIPRDQYDHWHMDGREVGFEERFIVPSTKTVDAMLYPGDPSASAGNLCNCRCTTVFIPVRDQQGKPVAAVRKETNVFGRLLDQARKVGQGIIGFINRAFKEDLENIETKGMALQT